MFKIRKSDLAWYQPVNAGPRTAE